MYFAPPLNKFKYMKPVIELFIFHESTNYLTVLINSEITKISYCRKSKNKQPNIYCKWFHPYLLKYEFLWILYCLVDQQLKFNVY